MSPDSFRGFGPVGTNTPKPKIGDGGHAFPATEPHPTIPSRFVHVGGMSLRDWFAGQALAGRMARNSIYQSWGDAADDAYDAADAMLAKRSKP